VKEKVADRFMAYSEDGTLYRVTEFSEIVEGAHSGGGDGAPPGRPARVASDAREVRSQVVGADHRGWSNAVNYARRSATSPPSGIITAGNREMTPMRNAILELPGLHSRASQSGTSA